MALEANRVLVIDDEQSMLEFLEYLLRKEGYQVVTAQAGSEALELLGVDQVDLVISDLRMPDLDGIELLRQARGLDPDTPFIFITAYASSDTAIEALKLGAFDYITKPFKVEELLHLVGNALLARNLKRKVKVLESDQTPESRLVGVSPPMLEIYKLIGTISATDSTILVAGESGTGKELVARAIHEASHRSRHPFVSINCGAFPEGLLESELFGYLKGAFTGAVANKKGLFEAAEGGTLFLDEVGEMSPAMQVKLLRALQERRIRRLGGTDEIPIDIRLIAATNRNLEEEIQTGGFREDLYYRLAVIPIRVPPLRERVSDVVTLVHHFIQKYNQRLDRKVRGISEEALACLERYHWPGNVRELENLIERAVALESNDFIQVEGLPEQLRQKRPGGGVSIPHFTLYEGLDLEDYLKQVERKIIDRALELAEGNQTKAADILKLTYRSFRHRLDKLRIAPRTTRPAESE